MSDRTVDVQKPTLSAISDRSKMPLLDHIVGTVGQGQWHGDAERLCVFEIDD
jgi:hypothetical protein